jgi:hypothetical protein
MEQFREIAKLAGYDGAHVIFLAIESGLRPREIKPLIEAVTKRHYLRPPAEKTKHTRLTRAFTAGVLAQGEVRANG